MSDHYKPWELEDLTPVELQALVSKAEAQPSG